MFFLALAVFFVSAPAFAQTTEDADYQEWVEYRDGEISLAFFQAPVAAALSAIRARTGFEFVLPPEAGSKLLNLRLTRLELEPAVRSVISSIGFKNFVLMYDEKGRPNRAVVLGTADNRASAPAAAPAVSRSAEPAVQPLSAQEREKLQKDLERWSELRQEERGRIEDRLKVLLPSEERDQLVKEYGRQLLGIKK